MIDSIVVLALVLLPGWISVTTGRLHSPRILDRTAVMQWGLLVYHAVVVHIISILISVILVGILTLISSDFFFTTLAIDRLFVDGARQYVESDPSLGFMVLGGYALLLVVISGFSGVIDLPSKITEGISLCARKCKLAGDPVSEVPLWYKAWRLDRLDANKKDVQLVVRMKNGDVYIGKLYEYQAESEYRDSRDIMLTGDVILWPGGDTSNEIDLSFDERGGGGVMLNSANISSIEYLYHGENEEDEEVRLNE